MARASKRDLDRPFGGVDAGADHLSLGPVDLAGAQVPDLAGAEAADAGAADPHPAAEREVGPGLFVMSGDSNGFTDNNQESYEFQDNGRLVANICP